MRTTARRATAILSFTAYLLSVVGAVIAYNLVKPLPILLGGPLAVIAIAGLCVFVGLLVQSTGTAEKSEIRETIGKAAVTTCVVVAVAGVSWSLLEAFASAPRLTGAWTSGAVIGIFGFCCNHFRVAADAGRAGER
jgi:uncharacterized membrane protein AbrB (regulator of aidB expression)